MGSISSFVSGFDPNALVDQLISLEQQPVLRLAAKKSNYEAKISVYGQIKSLLDSVKNSVGDLKEGKLLSIDGSSSDPSVLTVDTTSSAVEGEYQVVVNSLATSQTLYSNYFASETAEVADLSVVTSQTLKLQVGNGAATNITINSDNNSLTGVRDAINDAGVGITASIVDAGFTVDASNKVLMFNDGSDRTATLTEGTYTAATLAAELKRAMEAANGSDDTYTVSYNDTTNKFTFKNDDGNTNTLDLMFENASTTIEGLLGYDATDTSALAVGSSLEGNDAVGGYRLFLNSDATGSDGRISVKVDEDGNGTFGEAAETDTTGLSVLAFNPSYDSAGAVSGGVANLTQSQAATDASIVFDGVTVTRSSNTFSNVLTGVTFNLLDDSNSETLTVTVQNQTGNISTKLNSFINTYNQAIATIYDASNPVNGQGKILTGDATARNIVNSMRTTVTGIFEGKSLASLGLSHSSSGALTLDPAILDEEIDTDLDGVVATINAMATSFEATLENFVDTAIPAIEDGFKSSIKSVDNRILALNDRIEIIEEGLRRKFYALESLLGKFQRTSDYLTGALDALPKPGQAGGKK